MYEREPIRTTILDRGERHHDDSALAARGGNEPAQRPGIVRLTRAAVVKNDAPPGEVGVRRSFDFDLFAYVVTRVVVMNLGEASLGQGLSERFSGERPREIGRHGVGRIVRVLIGDRSAKHRSGAALGGRKIAEAG